MQQGAVNKKVISQKEVAKQKAIIKKKTTETTIKKRKEKKVKTEIKSFCDFTPVKVSFIGPSKKFSVTLGLTNSK